MIAGGRELASDLEVLRRAASETTRDLRGLRGEVSRPIGGGHGRYGIGEGMGLEALGVSGGGSRAIAQQIALQSTRLRTGAERFQRAAGIGALAMGVSSQDPIDAALGVASMVPGPIGAAALGGLAIKHVAQYAIDYAEKQRQIAKELKDSHERIQRRQSILRREDFTTEYAYGKARLHGGYTSEYASKRAAREKALAEVALGIDGNAANERLRKTYEEQITKYMAEGRDAGQASAQALQDIADTLMDIEQKAWSKAQVSTREAKAALERGDLTEAQRLAREASRAIQARYEKSQTSAETRALQAASKAVDLIAADPVAAYERQEARRTAKRHRMRWQMYFASSRTGD